MDEQTDRPKDRKYDYYSSVKNDDEKILTTFPASLLSLAEDVSPETLNSK